MRRILFAAFLLAFFGTAHAATPLLLEITKAVSIAVISDAAKQSLQTFLTSPPTKPTEFDKAKIKEIINRALNGRMPDERRLEAFAPRVDFYHRGIKARKEIVDQWKASYAKGYRFRVASIDLIELDAKGKFAAVSWTFESKRINDDRREAIVKKRVLLISDYDTRPVIVAMKDAS